MSPVRLLVGFLRREAAAALLVGPETGHVAAERIWHRYRDRVDSLVGHREVPDVGAVSEAMREHCRAVVEHRLFLRSYGSEFQIVEIELEPLLVLQAFVGQGEVLRHKARGMSDPVERARLCLPIEFSQRPVVSYAGWETVWRPHHAVVCTVGDRYLLLNGHHRLLALLEGGFDRAPVVLVGPERSQLHPPGLGFFDPGQVLTMPRPPLLGDFTEPRLVLTADLPALL
jgi:hypothetical protein